MNDAVKTILKPIASLRLTVWLLAMSMFLVFAGTLAQVDQGIWTVTRQYFRSPVTLIDLQLFVPDDLFQWEKVVGFRPLLPFPGGFVVGTLLLINLLAAHTVRFKFNWKRSGVLLIHTGIILLLAGEAVTALFSEEGNMTIFEQGYANYAEDIRSTELAFVNAADADHNVVAVVPDNLLTRRDVIADEALPLDVEVVQWFPNADLTGPMAGGIIAPNLATAGLGTRVRVAPKPIVAGVDLDSEPNRPAAYVRLSKQGEDQGIYLVSQLLIDQDIDIAGSTWQLGLRFKRDYKPYEIHLEDFRHDKFTGTNTPKNFSSDVRLIDPAASVDRHAHISMNHPMRYQGEAFFQAQYMPGDQGTVLLVVDNPGWLAPYIACIVVTLGLIIHFGMALIRFINKRSAAWPAQTKPTCNLSPKTNP